MTSGSMTTSPWGEVDLWRSNKQLRQTLTEAEEDQLDEWLDAAREADLEARRAEIEDELPEVDLDQPIPDDAFHTWPEEDLDRVIDWQYDQDILDESREREASAEEFAQAMSEVADGAAEPLPPQSPAEPPVFGPRRPLTAQQRFEIGFATTGQITPEMRAWEIAADAALSAQSGQRVTGQWVFGMSDPLLLSAGDELPEDAEVIGPAGDDYAEGDRMIRVPTARRKYRIGEDGTFLGQFAYDDRQAASLLYVSFYQDEGTYNLPVAYGILADVSTDRIFNTSTSRAPKAVLDQVRAEHNGGLWHDDDLSRPDQRWIEAEPQTLEEAMEFMAGRLVPKGLVADWVHDPDHPLNPTNRAQRRGQRFAPVEAGSEPGVAAPPAEPGAPPADESPPSADADEEGSTVEEVFGPMPQHLQELDAMPDRVPAEVDWGEDGPLWDAPASEEVPSADADADEGDEGSTVDEVFGPPPQHLQELDAMPDRVPAEVDWGEDGPLWDEDGATAPEDAPSEGPAEPVSGGGLLGGGARMVVAIAVPIVIAVIVAGVLSGGLLPGGDDASDSTPASTSNDQPAGTTSDQPSQPSPSTEARTPDGQVPELPAGWEAPPPFARADPTVRWSSGGSLWAWSVWQEPALTSKATDREAVFSVTQLTTIPAGTAIPDELVISVDCSADPCTYSTVYGAVAGDVDRRVTVPLTLNGLKLTGTYVPVPAATPTPADKLCSRNGNYDLEVTDLTVINNRLVPDFIRGARTLTTTCPDYVLLETIEINGRYLFRGSYADQ